MIGPLTYDALLKNLSYWLLNKFPFCSATWKFMTVVTTDHHLSISWVKWIQSTSYLLKIYYNIIPKLRVSCNETLSFIPNSLEALLIITILIYYFPTFSVSSLRCTKLYFKDPYCIGYLMTDLPVSLAIVKHYSASKPKGNMKLHFVPHSKHIYFIL
jgi:hypothetical protein